MPQESRNYYSGKRARKAAKFTVIFRAVSVVCGLLTSVLIVRLLPEKDYGIYNILYSFVPMVMLVLSFGIDNTMTRFIPEFVKQGEFRLADKLSRYAQTIRLTTSVVIMTALTLSWNYWSPIFNLQAYRTAFLIFTAILVLQLQQRLLLTVLTSHLLQKYALGIRTMLALFKLVAYAVLYFSGLNLVEVLLVDVVTFGIGVVALLVSRHRYVPRTSGARTEFGPEDRRRVLRYAAFYNFNDIGTFTLGKRIDNLFIAAYVGPVAVGAYSLASTVLNAVTQSGPVTFFQTIIQPLFFSLDRERQRQQVVHYFQLLLKVVYIFNIPVTAFICYFHNEIVAVIFGGKFQDYSYLLAVVCAFALFAKITVPVSLVAQLSERAGIVLASKIFAVYNIVAMLWLVPKIGILGAAVATGTAFAFKEFFIWWFVRELASFRGMGRFFALSIGLWVAFGAVAYMIQKLSPNAAVSLALGVIAALACGLVYLRLPLLNTEETEFLAKHLPSRAAVPLARIGLLRGAGRASQSIV